MAGNDRRPASLVPDDRCQITCEIVQRQPFHRTDTYACTPRLRAQHVKAGTSNSSGDVIEIFRTSSPRWQKNNKRSGALSNHVNSYIVIGDNPARTLSLRRANAHTPKRLLEVGDTTSSPTDSGTFSNFAPQIQSHAISVVLCPWSGLGQKRKSSE